ncbi:DUF4192 family protein [Arthrobacter sp. 31Y]|uniref:DUF4192 family protein n=1 Tax=Arthrobacter sp. 31Y TaxID=1115632 RepID=UPI0004B4F964|nr:DUF4192 family protein [Arthrobacter sp. 31Y]
MSALTIKDPADLLSFIGHTIGFWSTESLVCITLDKDNVGATLRIDLPQQPGYEVHFAQTVAAYLTTDEQANGIIFALYTTEQPAPGEARPHRATIAALTGALAREGITMRDGIYVNDTTHSPPTTPAPVRTSPSRSAPPNTQGSTPNSSTAAAPSHPPTK